MNILEFRHHEPNIRRALEAGMVSKLKIETIENPSRRADPMVGQDEQLLGKRFQPRPVEEMLSELKNRKQVAKCISDRQQDQLQQELHYMRDFRVKTEIWKKLMVRRNPATVSFVIHNVNMVADR